MLATAPGDCPSGSGFPHPENGSVDKAEAKESIQMMGSIMRCKFCGVDAIAEQGEERRGLPKPIERLYQT